MPKGTNICKICGIEYPYCKTVTTDRFRWQDVACCPEHGVQYFRDIATSRGEDEPEFEISADQKIIVKDVKTSKKGAGKKGKVQAEATEE